MMLDPNDPDDGTIEWIDRERERCKERMHELWPGALLTLVLCSIMAIIYYFTH